MTRDGPISEEIASAFNAAADRFQAAPLSFWDHIGKRTIELAKLNLGGKILDVGCGSGASAIPAAKAVGPSGRVVAVDLSEQLLTLGREKAAMNGLRNLEFVCRDMTTLDYPRRSFDAVVSSLSIFFVEDMDAQIRKLWSLLRPGGILAVTCWGQNVLEPAMSAWSTIVKDERPDLLSEPSPGDRISSPDDLRTLFRDGGTEGAIIVDEPGSHTIAKPTDWWDIVMGSGLRGVMEEMTAGEFERVRSRTMDWAARAEVTSLELNVLYGRSIKPRRK
ncbi:class I SAM-dependent methyltransferase [Aliiruegeria sabulilitoris]|uniref:class I SAM-dependent methyltransferase n=1 Tax=Aliiruegeria sabulilitoris TaxID=1510458 RepID=UPI00082EDB8D|nr:class I SAM-dependent methyltransferase [Aliiruegeria sabulilitoris]NDR58646.1 methyltransferase domain-containing protein [Pseudoruegeria sp. M32A2M]